MKPFIGRLIVPVVALPLACANPATQSTPASRSAPNARAGVEGISLESAAETITAADMRRHIAYLASDELKGRDTPSPGLEMAAAYLAREFEAMGLEPAGDQGSFLQRYPYPVRALAADRVRLEFQGPGGRKTPAHGADYFVDAGVPVSFEGAPVFLGHADEVARGPAPALRGRVAVAYLPGSIGPDWQVAMAEARQAAAEAGAIASLFVLDPAFGADLVGRMAAAQAEPRRALGELETPPAYFVGYEAARPLFQTAGLDLDGLRRDALGGPIAPVALSGVTIAATAPVTVLEDARPPNVVALLRGSDPELRDSYVVFSAHMDHVGVRRPDERGDSIYNGADDDASGTAALLEIAEAFAALPEPPARSLVFLAVSGEEKGLLGSRYFTDHPTIPLENTVANINMDMIGRNAPDTIVVIGQEYSSLGPLVRSVAAQRPGIGLTVSPDIWPEERFFFRSDHFNFARKDIPALFFFAGVHEDYHRPSDEVDKIDADKAARVARLGFYTAHAIATRAEPPEWTEEGLAEVRALTR